MLNSLPQNDAHHHSITGYSILTCNFSWELWKKLIILCKYWTLAHFWGDFTDIQLWGCDLMGSFNCNQGGHAWVRVPESWHLLETEYYVCHLPEWYCGTYRACLSFLAFLFLSFYCDNSLSVGLLCWASCMCISCSLHLLLFLLYFVYDWIIIIWATATETLQQNSNTTHCCVVHKQEKSVINLTAWYQRLLLAIFDSSKKTHRHKTNSSLFTWQHAPRNVEYITRTCLWRIVASRPTGRAVDNLAQGGILINLHFRYQTTKI